MKITDQTAVVTIVSNNYLHFARTLMQSVAQQHPEADRYCVIVDRDIQHATALIAEFQPLVLSQLNLPDGEDFFFQYNVLELNTAIKPWALEHLIRKGYKNVVYIDPDIFLYRPLNEALAALDAGADLVLTPHLLAPMTDTRTPSELDIRRSGTYNLGFCALRGGGNMLAMLEWWQRKLRYDCVIAHDRGVFVDQSWMDLVPGLFSNVFVLRHPGYNLAYWNLAQRLVQESTTQTLVAGEPLVFFHFSGLNPLEPRPISKHHNRFTLDSVGLPVANLITEYCQRVINNGLEHYRSMAYSFGSYDSGAPITDADRTQFRTQDALRGRARGKPFGNRALLSTNTADEPDQSPQILADIYVHLLGRSPDESAKVAWQQRLGNPGHQLKTTLSVATSREARAKPGWLARWLSWHLRAAQHARPKQMAQPTPAVQNLVKSRPSPFGGLNAPEQDSARNGFWVGPRLDLPTCVMTNGQIQIKGSVDLGLLRLSKVAGDFQLCIYGPEGHLHTEVIKHAGLFTINLTVPASAFDTGNQWTVLASKYVIPQDCGVGSDARELSWRVTSVAVDSVVLLDSSRSPSCIDIQSIVPASGVNLVGYLAAELGIGEGTRSLAKALLAAGIPYSAVDVGFQTQNAQRDTSMLALAVPTRFPIDIIYVNADQTAAITSHLKHKGLQSNYRIGYWVWEQTQLPSSALGAFAHVDEIWVPSKFAYHAIAPYSPVPVIIIPHALELSPSPNLSRTKMDLPEDKLLVLVMYDFHSYQYRKNPQAAIAAFRLAAAKRTDTALVIKTINGHHYASDRQALQTSVSDMPNVIFIDEFLTRQQTWDLQASCDIFLSLHRAEGFGLAPAEMMYLGKPVIATGWSANTDFMTHDNSFLVRYQLQTLRTPVGVYPAGLPWAEADIDHAASCLTLLLDNPVLRQQMGAKAAADIREQLSPKSIGALVQQRLSLLSFWDPTLRQTTVGPALN